MIIIRFIFSLFFMMFLSGPYFHYKFNSIMRKHVKNTEKIEEDAKYKKIYYKTGVVVMHVIIFISVITNGICWGAIIALIGLT